jgi:hypothetical protein
MKHVFLFAVLLLCAAMARAQQQSDSFVVSLGSIHWVGLSCTGSTTPGVVGYWFFRGAASGQESATPLNASLSAGCAFPDLTVAAGNTYFYMATAVGADGVTQSADSNEASATVPAP